MDIEAGFISEALIALTGAPVHTYFVPNGDPEENWRVMLEGEKHNYIMACASSDINKTGNDNADRRTGLSGNHAYSLLSAHEVYHNGRQVRLVKLRNPWGKGEWTGDWSDSSPMWTDDVRRQVGYNQLSNEDDGIFFMSFNDWMKYFHDFDVCYYHDNYINSSKKFSSSSSTPTIIKFQINQGGDVYFMVSQINTRMFKKADRYAYSNLTLIVARLEGGSMQHIGTASQSDMQIWFKANCAPGEYVAYVETPWKRNVNTFTFGVYAQEQINFTPGDSSSFSNGFVSNILMDKARKDQSMLKNYAAQGEPNIFYRFETSSDSFSFFYFMNQSQNTTVKATLQMVDSVGIEVLPPNNTGRNPEIEIGPGEENIVVCKLVGTQAKLSCRVAASFIQGRPQGQGGQKLQFGGGGGFGGGNQYGGGGNYSNYGGAYMKRGKSRDGNFGGHHHGGGFGGGFGGGRGYLMQSNNDGSPSNEGSGYLGPNYGGPQGGFNQGFGGPDQGFGGPGQGFGGPGQGFGGPGQGFGGPDQGFGGPGGPGGPGFGGNFQGGPGYGGGY